MNHTQKAIELTRSGKVNVINPNYLAAQSEQTERSLLGQRTVFLKFQRFLFDLSDHQIKKLWDNYKIAYAQASKDFPDEICCDLSLLCDAIQFQLGLRDDNQADPAICEQIAISFRQNAKLANNYDEITSDYLIDICKEWLNNNA